MGSINAARVSLPKKCAGKSSNVFSWFFTGLMALFAPGMEPVGEKGKIIAKCVGFLALLLPIILVSCEVVAPAVNTSLAAPKSGSASKIMWSGCLQLLCIAVAAFLLSRCGDVETNPGPGCEYTKLPIFITRPWSLQGKLFGT